MQGLADIPFPHLPGAVVFRTGNRRAGEARDLWDQVLRPAETHPPPHPVLLTPEIDPKLSTPVCAPQPDLMTVLTWWPRVEIVRHSAARHLQEPAPGSSWIRKHRVWRPPIYDTLRLNRCSCRVRDTRIQGRTRQSNFPDRFPNISSTEARRRHSPVFRYQLRLESGDQLQDLAL